VSRKAGDIAASAARPASKQVMATLRHAEQPERPFLPRLKMFSDMPDRGLFVIFIAIGFVLIVGVKTYIWRMGIAEHRTLEITVLTAILMIAYGVLAYRVPDVRMRPDRLGDNFYYMGFIFTLASMSAALVQLQSGDEVGALISSFGIALASTILGIAGRVFFVQMRTEVEDIEERVRQDLLAAANELKGQLGAATRDLDSFRTGIQQAIHERFEETATSFSEVLSAQIERLREAVERTILATQEAFREHEAAAARLVSVGISVTEASNRLATRLDAVSVPSDVLDRQLAVVADRVGSVVTNFEQAAEAERGRYIELSEGAAQLRRVVTQIATQLAKLQEVSRGLGEAVEPAQKLNDRVTTTSKSLESVRGAVVGLVQSIGEVQAAAGSMADAATAHGQALTAASRIQGEAATAAARDADAARVSVQEDLAASRAAVVEVQKALTEMVQAITVGLGPARQ